MNPYAILGVSVDAGDQEIRAAWVRAVQENPPEADPLRFQQVQEAWQSIRDARARARRAVRPRPAPGDSPAAALKAFAAAHRPLQPPGTAAFRSYLQACRRPPARS